MTTSEQAALLAKHYGERYGDEMWCPQCAGGNDPLDYPFPCDVHRMAELKDAEIAQAVSEAVERIVSALSQMDNFHTVGQVRRAMAILKSDAIALLRSRDWSKGEG